MKTTIITLGVSLVLASSIARADEARMHVAREASGMRTFAAAPRIVERLQLSPAVMIGAAAEEVPEELSALRQWNAEGREPYRNGIVRSLGETLAVRFGGGSADRSTRGRGVTAETAGGMTWGTSIRVGNARRLRAHLENVELPDGTTLWVYGTSGQPVAFDAALIDDQKALWTPSVDGDTLYLEVEAPAGQSVSFDVKEVLELLYARGTGPQPKSDDAPTCLNGQDINCQSTAEFPAMTAVRRAIGQMEFVVPGGGGAVCSGALINDQKSTGARDSLTANHCIATQSSASSLETYFDFDYDSCVASTANWLPAVNGSTLLTTSTSTDVTLLRLSSLPSNRVFLGWSTTPPANGARLHRISHPVPDGFPAAEPQLYSRTIVTTTASTCSGISRPNYVYSNELGGGEGGTYGGSSGSAAILSDSADDARIVGQLRGGCGPDPSAGCDRRNNTVDGAFAMSYSVLQPYLAPATSAVCTPDSSTICIMNNRFSVRLTYDIGQGPKPMTAIKYTANTGLFWFADASNIEVILKMVDACSFNSRFWVFVGGTTDVGVVITVTDTKNGTVKTYTHPRGSNFVTITDTGAFATCP